MARHRLRLRKLDAWASREEASQLAPAASRAGARIGASARAYLVAALEAWERGEPIPPREETEQDRADHELWRRWCAAAGIPEPIGAKEEFLRRIDAIRERRQAAAGIVVPRDGDESARPAPEAIGA